jgi:multidrug efflux pump subunit AcrA (membrane-fusion protein)
LIFKGFFLSRPPPIWHLVTTFLGFGHRFGHKFLRVELLVDNPNGVLFPGAYTQVHFKLPRGTESLRVPANTVLFRSTGLQVAVVGPDDRVTLKNITTGRDFGSSLEVLTGLAPGDNIVVDPSDSMETGTPVRILVPHPLPRPQPQSPSAAPVMPGQSGQS